MKKQILFGIGCVLVQIGLFPLAAEARPYCREYTEHFVINGRHQQGYGVACRQPDGAWRIKSSHISPVGRIIPNHEFTTYIVEPTPPVAIVEVRPGYHSYDRHNYREHAHYRW